MRYLLLIFVLAACQLQEMPTPVKVFGHAGNGLDIIKSIYHDNSKEAIELALSLPDIDGVEVDVRMSADGTLWLYHENTLEAESEGQGSLSACTDLQLAPLHYKSLHHERLVRLSEVLPLIKPGQQFLLDLKHWNATSASAVDLMRFKNALLALLQNQSNCVVLITNASSFVPLLTPHFNVVFESGSREELHATLMKYPQLRGVVMRNAALSEADVRAFKAQGKWVFAFDVRASSSQKKALLKGPSSLLSDDPKEALRIRDAMH
ncbi:MAG: hypothetical protein RLZZ301_527 [Bacteroidota bacterium]|jgi:glycerophosphoryl diester phosphodiesterase